MTPEADVLADALRRLLATTVSTQGGDPAVLKEAAELVERATAVLEPQAAAGPGPHTMAFQHPYSIVTGSAHPLAPPVEVLSFEGGARGRFRLGKQYEGGPGLVHGGVLALLFDHVLGEAAIAAGVGGMTVGLNVRYTAPTPLDADLEITGRVAEIDGRKVHLAGEVTLDGTSTATATALFIQIDESTAAQLFPHLQRS